MHFANISLSAKTSQFGSTTLLLLGFLPQRSVPLKDGWIEVRQKGSHIIMQHPTNPKQLTVPFHSGKEVKKGLLKAILKQAEIKTSKR